MHGLRHRVSEASSTQNLFLNNMESLRGERGKRLLDGRREVSKGKAAGIY